MSQINGISGVTPGGLTGTDGKESAGQGTAQTFSASYKLALANASLSQEAATAANSSSPANGSRHIPLAGQQQKEGGEDIHEVTLGLRAYRQQLLASNIANADTPGYKAVDIDFQEALRIARTTMQGGSVKLSTTAEGHISAQAPTKYSNIPLKYPVPQQASIDGNTVEMDVERAKFTENALMYQFSIDRVGGHYKDMAELLKNLT
ncbi:MAG: flagellar basal body rod protein FlgB [Halothiobacillus sp.]